MVFIMTSIYLDKSTKEMLYKFINRSRVSPAFGSPLKLKTPNLAIKMLLDFALRYDFDDFEHITKIPSYVSTLEPEIFDNEELRNQIISEQISDIENGD